MTQARPNKKLWFLHAADGLYVAARFALFARLTTALFRLSHHAVEYYLKAHLVETLGVPELKRCRHNLILLYEAYKVVAQPSIDRSDIVEYLNNFEKLRYPGDVKFRMRAWNRPFEEFFSEIPLASDRAKIFWFDLAGFDSLIADLRNSTCSLRECPFMIASNDHAEYLYRENMQFQRPENMQFQRP